MWRARLIADRLAWLTALFLLPPIAPAQAVDPPSLSASIDGHNWVSTRQLAVTFRFGPNLALNITGLLDGPPTSRLSFNLVLTGDNDYQHQFELRPAAAATSHGHFTLNVMSLDTDNNVFNVDSGSLAIERYDAASRTVSGRFSAVASNAARTRTLRISDGVFANIPVLTGETPTFRRQ
jgi:hypothetical protein